MKKIFILTLVLITACKAKEEKLLQNHSVHQIILEKHTKNRTLNDILSMEYYVVLSNKVVLGNIKKTIIWNDRIYIMDSQSKIVCFSITGKYLFQIFNKGRGPGEYMEIHNFAIDTKNEVVNVYCNSSQKLLSYSSKSGKFKTEQKMRMSPLSIACNNGYNYYYSPYRTVPDKDLQYTLLSSTANKDISERMFAYNSISSFRFRPGLDFPFYYNQGEVYFKKRFEPIIYTLKSGRALPKYKIVMPNMTPLSFWERKPSRDAISSHQGIRGINNVYECNNYLYYHYRGEKQSGYVFYDITKDVPLYYSYEKPYISTSELPIFTYIRGVYNQAFFCIIDAVVLSRFSKDNPETIPDKLKKIEASDNPVIFFYKPKAYEN